MSFDWANSVSGRIKWRLRDIVLSRPPPPAPYAVGSPVAVAGLFRTASGIGQSARACANALEQFGIDVTRIDLSTAFHQADLPEDSRLTHEVGDCRTVIIHLNAPEFERAAFLLRSWRGTGRRTIGYWAWELPVTPHDWAPATRWLSEVWVPSRFTASALAPLTSKPVRVVPHFISELPSLNASSVDLGSQDVRCIALADAKSSFERKNLIGAVEAFRCAQLGPNSSLVLKTRGLNTDPEYRERLADAINGDTRIRIVEQSVSHEEVLALIASSDVLLSLHRSEGFGLAIAEAMLLGKPVVATDWSGSTDFLDETCGYPIPANLIPVKDPCGVYVNRPDAEWADASISDAAKAISRLAADPPLRQQIGRAGRTRIQTFADGHQYIDALLNPYP